MNREELQEVLRRAPPPGDPRRLLFLEEATGELFGWISMSDRIFLADWLPTISAQYPRQPMTLVEVGTFAGGTARGLIVLTGGGEITSIDNFVDVHPHQLEDDPDAATHWVSTLRKHGTDLSAFGKIVVGNSDEVGQTWSSPIDLLFIDGDHRYEAALRDMQLFGAHVVEGGYCLVDDYDLLDVRRACDEYFHGWTVERRPPSLDPSEGKLLCLRRP